MPLVQTLSCSALRLGRRERSESNDAAFEAPHSLGSVARLQQARQAPRPTIRDVQQSAQASREQVADEHAVRVGEVVFANDFAVHHGLHRCHARGEESLLALVRPQRREDGQRVPHDPSARLLDDPPCATVGVSATLILHGVPRQRLLRGPF